MADEKVSREELEAFSKAVGDRICELESRLMKEIEKLSSEFREPKEVKLAIYRCEEEGCKFVTEDLGAFVEHTIDERLQKLSLTAPTEKTGWEEEEPKIRHRTVKEFMDCPECFSKFEKAMFERGWEKPEPKRERESFPF